VISSDQIDIKQIYVWFCANSYYLKPLTCIYERSVEDETVYEYIRSRSLSRQHLWPWLCQERAEGNKNWGNIAVDGPAAMYGEYVKEGIQLAVKELQKEARWRD